MFGLFKRPKPIPAANRERVALIRELLRKRLEDDPIARMMAFATNNNAEELPNEVLLGLPEATIVDSIENYLTMKRQGMPDADIFKYLHEAYKVFLEQEGSSLEACPFALDLRGYLSFIVEAQHGHGGRLPAGFLEYAIKRVVTYYS
jgi:AcrR family transcriptional regulator